MCATPLDIKSGKIWQCIFLTLRSRCSSCREIITLLLDTFVVVNKVNVENIKKKGNFLMGLGDNWEIKAYFEVLPRIVY